MDNKITKSRLSNFFGYEWLLMLLVFGLAVLGWEIAFAVGRVKLTYGQEFNFYYDIGISANDSGFDAYLSDVFSYDVQSFGGSSISEDTGDTDMLYVYYSAGKADAVFTDAKKEESEGYRSSRLNTLIDSYEVYDMQSLYDDAVKYLSSFLKEGETDCFVFSNLDKTKIEKGFKERNGKDNRYRAGQISVQNEYERIEKLCREVKDFGTVLQYDKSLSAEESIFYKYTKYEQTYNLSIGYSDEQESQEMFQAQTEKSYGLKLEKLPTAQNKRSASEFFWRDGQSDCKDVVLTVFRSFEENDALQFESISFVNAIVRSFSSVLD